MSALCPGCVYISHPRTPHRRLTPAPGQRVAVTAGGGELSLPHSPSRGAVRFRAPVLAEARTVTPGSPFKAKSRRDHGLCSSPRYQVVPGGPTPSLQSTCDPNVRGGRVGERHVCYPVAAA